MTEQETGLVAFNSPSALAIKDDIFNVEDTIKGVKGRIPQIKIIHQAQMFADAADQKFNNFEGIILHHSPTNAYWEESFEKTGGGTIPDCYSLNGESPLAPEGKSVQNKNCHSCTFNQFGSDKDGGKGKACKNMWRLHILVKGQLIPKRLTLPPSNLGTLQDFLMMLRDKNVAHERVVVNFSLRKTSNKDGIEYAEIVLQPVSIITDRAKALELKKIKDSFAFAFGEVVEAEEYKA